MRGRGERLGRDAVVRARALEEVVGQRPDVRAALAQRRQREREDGQPVVEVLSKAPLTDRRPEVLVGRGDDPHVHGLVPGGPEAPHRALFQHFEELRLERLGQEPDLVEEDRSAVRRLEEARLGAPRVRERATLEPEHLGLEQRLGNRRAVHVHERTVRAWARTMDDACEQPLAGARLPFDQHRRHTTQLVMSLDQPPELVAYSLDPGALAEELGHRPHRSQHVTPTGQLGVQVLTTHHLGHPITQP